MDLVDLNSQSTKVFYIRHIQNRIFEMEFSNPSLPPLSLIIQIISSWINLNRCPCPWMLSMYWISIKFCICTHQGYLDNTLNVMSIGRQILYINKKKTWSILPHHLFIYQSISLTACLSFPFTYSILSSYLYLQ